MFSTATRGSCSMSETSSSLAELNEAAENALERLAARFSKVVPNGSSSSELHCAFRSNEGDLGGNPGVSSRSVSSSSASCSSCSSTYVSEHCSLEELFVAQLPRVNVPQRVDGCSLVFPPLYRLEWLDPRILQATITLRSALRVRGKACAAIET